MEQFIKLGTKPNIIDTFDEQDILILSKVKKENKMIAKSIIAEYGLTHPLKHFIKKYKDNYDELEKSLLIFSNKRYFDLLELTKKL